MFQLLLWTAPRTGQGGWNRFVRGGSNLQVKPLLFCLKSCWCCVCTNSLHNPDRHVGSSIGSFQVTTWQKYQPASSEEKQLCLSLNSPPRISYLDKERKEKQPTFQILHQNSCSGIRDEESLDYIIPNCPPVSSKQVPRNELRKTSRRGGGSYLAWRAAKFLFCFSVTITISADRRTLMELMTAHKRWPESFFFLSCRVRERKTTRASATMENVHNTSTELLWTLEE